MLEVGLENTDYAFNCAFDLLVEALAFTMNIYKQVYRLHIKYKTYDRFFPIFIKNTILVKNFIIAVNWQLMICGINLDTPLLHNFKIDAHINSRKEEYISKYYYEHYNIYDNERIDQKIMDEVAIVFSDYYEKNIIGGDKGIYEIEEFQSILRYCKEHLPLCKNDYYIAACIAFNAIVIKRGRFTKLHYFAKSSYYKDSLGETKEIKLSETQEKFLKTLEKICVSKNNIQINHEMIFETQNMHTFHTKMNICMLSFQMLNNITRLTDFTNKYIDLLTKGIAEKHKKAVIDYFDALIRKIGDKQIVANLNLEELEQDKETIFNQIEAIESPSSILQEMKKTEKLEILETYKNKINSSHYENEYQSIFDKINCFNDMTNTTQNHNLKEKTVEIYKSIIGLDFFDKICKIIILQEKIEKEIDEIVYKKVKAFLIVENMINGTSLTYEGLKHEQAQNQNEDWLTMQEKKIIFEQLKNNENINEFYDLNKVTFESIINDTIELTGMIIEAENDAHTLIEIIKKYDEI
ncbi:hypothetical protein BDAP_002496 [Binucleata daphniae]